LPLIFPCRYLEGSVRAPAGKAQCHPAGSNSMISQLHRQAELLPNWSFQCRMTLRSSGLGCCWSAYNGTVFDLFFIRFIRGQDLDPKDFLKQTGCKVRAMQGIS